MLGFAGDTLINYSEFSVLEYSVFPCSQEILFSVCFFSVLLSDCLWFEQLCSLQKTARMN